MIFNPLVQWYFTFKYIGPGTNTPGLGLNGIWIGKIASEVIMAIGYYVIVHQADFEQIIKVTASRFNQDESILSHREQKSIMKKT